MTQVTDNSIPIKLLFDGAILTSISNIAYKRGIYYVAYNLINKFIEDDRFDVTIWLEKNFSTECIKNDENLKNIKIAYSNFIIGQGSSAKIIKNPKFNKNDYEAYINVGHDSQLSYNGNSPSIFNVLHDCIAIMDEYNFYPGTDYPEYFKDFHSKLSKDIWTFCVSEHTKKDFLKNFNNLNESKMTVSYIASAHNLCPKKNKINFTEIAKKYNVNYDTDNEYIFYLGSVNDPRKNLLYTIYCFFKFIEKYNITNLYFYLGGYGKEVLINELETQCKELYDKYKKYIVFLGFIDDNDINDFYSNSMFFVFLSLYEGFGLPPIEAMQAGIPVICADNSSLPEVVGDAAILVNLGNKDKIIESFAKLYFDKELRTQLSKKGIERAKNFSWEKTYKIISEKIIEVVSKNVATV